MIESVYVCFRVDWQLFDQDVTKNYGVEALAYSTSKMELNYFMEEAAARDVYGQNFSNVSENNLFYDPDEQEENPPPDSRFMVWDDVEPEDPILNRPTSVESSISVFASIYEFPSRPILRSYKIARVLPCVQSFVNATTEGDLHLVAEVTKNSSSQNLVIN
jgi:hypothetical protein